LLDHDDLIGIEGAELVLHIDAGLATHGEQVFALHVQLARQCEDAFFLALQAQLLVRTRSCQ
jgi:hypothetical protein